MNYEVILFLVLMERCFVSLIRGGIGLFAFLLIDEEEIFLYLVFRSWKNVKWKDKVKEI